MEFRSVAELDPIEEGMRLLIQGQVSSGKSFLAASIGEPKKKARFFDFEGKLSALARHSNAANIEGRTYIDPPIRQGKFPQPTAFNNFMLDLGQLEYLKSEGKLEPAYNVIDTVTFLEGAIVRDELYKNPSARKTISVGGSELLVPEGWDAYKNAKYEIEALLNRIFALGDTICIAHERPEIDRSVSPKETMDKRLTGRFSLEPPRLDIIKSLFKDKYRVSSIGSSFTVFLNTNEDFLGACTFHGCSASEPADLHSIIEKHRAFMAQRSKEKESPTDKK